MFDIGLGEMIVLGAIALIAIGPKQLPEVARTVGRMLNEFRRATGEISRSFDHHRHQAPARVQEPASVEPDHANSKTEQLSFDIGSTASGAAERKEPQE